MSSVWLMYHNVYEATCDPELPRSATMYHVSRHSFANHLAEIRNSGRTAVLVRDYPKQVGQNSVVITFDDGWRGSFHSAVPMLQAAGWKATFFVTRDFVGRKGFCDPQMIREAADAGMEIGVHGTTHRMLSRCSTDEITSEFATCKAFLESIVGAPVVSASLPGGDINRRITSCARQTGLTSLCTSRPGINRAGTSWFALRRIAIRSITEGPDIARYCRYDVRKEVMRWAALEVPRSILGMKNYSLLRRWILGESVGHHGEVFKP
jgi:peptidoglycan/xylan/chitin deacetylase (PgdA/CDA1 family)